MSCMPETSVPWKRPRRSMTQACCCGTMRTARMMVTAAHSRINRPMMEEIAMEKLLMDYRMRSIHGLDAQPSAIAGGDFGALTHLRAAGAFPHRLPQGVAVFNLDHAVV